MPKVLEIDGLRVVIYPNDHRPEHVHVIGRGCEAVFELRGDEGIPMVRESYGFRRREIARIGAALAANLTVLLEAWERIHG